jgi:hypothetical protein
MLNELKKIQQDDSFKYITEFILITSQLWRSFPRTYVRTVDIFSWFI